MQIATRQAARDKDASINTSGRASMVNVISRDAMYMETQKMQNSVLIPCTKKAMAMLNNKTAPKICWNEYSLKKLSSCTRHKKKMGVEITLIPIPISVIPCMPPWLYHFLLGGPFGVPVGVGLELAGVEESFTAFSGAAFFMHMAEGVNIFNSDESGGSLMPFELIGRLLLLVLLGVSLSFSWALILLGGAITRPTPCPRSHSPRPHQPQPAQNLAHPHPKEQGE